MSRSEEYTKEQQEDMKNNLAYLFNQKKQEITKTQVASEMGFSPSKISKLLSGKNKFDSELVDKICTIFEIDEEKFVNSNFQKEELLAEYEEPGFPSVKFETTSDFENDEVERDDLNIALSYQQYKLKSISGNKNKFLVLIFLILGFFQTIATSFELLNDRITYYTSMIIIFLTFGVLVYILFNVLSNLGYKTKVFLVDSRKRVIFENKPFKYKGVSIVYSFAAMLFSCITLIFMAIGYNQIDWVFGLLLVYFIIIAVFTIINLFAIKSRYTLRIDYKLYYLSGIRRYSVIVLFLLSVGYVMAIETSFWVHLAVIIFSFSTLLVSEILFDFVLQYYEGYQKEEK